LLTRTSSICVMRALEFAATAFNFGAIQN
jgi:hypothetical protein